MSQTVHRRQFLASAAASTTLPVLEGLPPVAAAEAQPDPNLVRLDSGIEPVVRLIEETPREQLLEAVARRIKQGALSYRDVLAGLFLAGVRNVQPRPNVGFKFHAVLVVYSAHQAAMAGSDQDRWLPLFWSLDYFKSAQAQTLKESGWRMRPVEESRVPPPERVREAFIEAMDRWDEAAADAAAAGLARYLPTDEAFALFARYGCRDFRDIGHKAIYVANGFRVLQVIGRQHAEPFYRSLTYALLRHEGRNPAQADLPPDRPGRRTAELLRRHQELFQGPWASGRADGAATRGLLGMLRQASDAEVCQAVIDLLRKQVSPRSIWEALHMGAAELLMRQPGIVSLHTLTSLNALRYAYDTVSDHATLRPTLLLQAASFLPLFREAMKGRGPLEDRRIDELTPDESPQRIEPADIFATLSRDRHQAARQTLAYLLQRPDGLPAWAIEARRLIFLKGRDSHDYKFSSAILEDAEQLSPQHRERYVAACIYWLKGTQAPDAPIVQRARQALA